MVFERIRKIDIWGDSVLKGIICYRGSIRGSGKKMVYGLKSLGLISGIIPISD